MDSKRVVAQLLWEELLGSAVGKQVEVSLYPTLRNEIPDKRLVIEVVVNYQEADEIFERFRPYLGEFGVFPILGTLGGNVLCIGIADKNRGVVYYYDFDFGLFELRGSIRLFMEELITGT